MMRKPAVLLVLSTLLLAPLAAQAKANEAVERPVRTLIGAVRYNKDALALKFLAGPAQGRFLLGDAWKKATPAQQKAFVKLFHGLFAAIAFPKIRANFKYLSTIVYDAPKVKGDSATLDSTLVILNPLKKEELKVRYELTKVHGAWKVLDVTVLGTGGQSMLTNIRDHQVKPILANGGMSHLLDLMKKRLAEVQGGKK